MTDRDDKRARAEIAIERILRDLEDTTEKIDHVEVDTRNFANLSVGIFFKSEAVCDERPAPPFPR